MVFGSAKGESSSAAAFDSLDALDQHSAAAPLKPTQMDWDYIARWMGRCRMLKQIGLSTFFGISYTFLPVRTFILITSDNRGIRSFSF
jgi:hypothetical protein